MTMKHRVFRTLFAATSCLFCLSFSGFQTIEIAGNSVKGDTAAFSPNDKVGWQVLDSYLDEISHDSVEFDLVLKKNGKIDGKRDNLIGYITKKTFIPLNDQQIDYYLLPDNIWVFRISKEGRCYLKQRQGASLKPSTLEGNPDVIPIKIRYKIN